MPLDVEFVQPQTILTSKDDRLVDLIDGLLDHGVVLYGELWLTVADVDLVYLGLSVVLTAPHKVDRSQS